MTPNTGDRGSVARFLPVLALLIGCAACSNSGSSSSQSSPDTGSSVSATASSAPTATGPCAEVLSAGSALAATLGQYYDGKETLDQVKSDGDALRAAVTAAKPTVSVALRARFTDLTAAVADLENAVTTRPVDEQAVRSAGAKVLAAVRALARPCVSASPSP